MAKKTTKFDEQKLTELLDQGKFSEAGEVMREALAADLTPEERGAALVNFSRLYVQLNNAASERFLGVMDETLDTLKSMDRTMNKVEEEMTLATAKKKVKNA